MHSWLEVFARICGKNQGVSFEFVKRTLHDCRLMKEFTVKLNLSQGFEDTEKLGLEVTSLVGTISTEDIGDLMKNCSPGWKFLPEFAAKIKVYLSNL